MIYKTLPKVGALGLPRLTFRASPNVSSRNGARPLQVWLHRWAGGSYRGVCDWLCNPAADVSAHLVYAGGLGSFAGEATQLVPYARKAWTQEAYNSIGLSIECADAIFLGHDPEGFAQLARIVAFLLHHNGLPAVWVRDPHTHRRGFLRHADGGQAAGGHTQCPTTDLALWGQLRARVGAELRHGGFRRSWGR